MTDRSKRAILGVVLAGGQSRRMGGPDKAFETIGDRTLLAHATQRLLGQVQHAIINANGDTLKHRDLGLPVIPDTLAGYQGPLAGVLAAMQFAGQAFTHIVTVATDTPFFPGDLVARLSDAANTNETIAMATSSGNRHPTFALWPVTLADDLEAWLTSGENPKIMAWVQRHDHTMVDFPCAEGLDPFFNINTPGDLETARARMDLEAHPS